MNIGDLKSKLIQIRSTMYPTPDQAAHDWCEAITQFWMSGIGPGGSAPDASACLAAMTPQVAGAWANLNTTPDQSAQSVESGVIAGITALKMAGGIYGTHIATVPPPPGSLSGSLGGLWATPHQTPEEVGGPEADYINSFSMQAVFNGTGITPAPPVSGPMT